MTPPGSACSIAFGKGLTKMAPGSLDNLQMVVADADAAHDQLAGRGVEVSDVDDQPWGGSSTSTIPTATAGRCSSCPNGRPAPAAVARPPMAEPRTYPEGVTAWIDVEQPDLEAAQAFYAGLFGWTFQDATPAGTPPATSSPSLTAAPSPVSGVVDASAADRGGTAGAPTWNTCVAVDDADDVARRIGAAGGRVLYGPSAAGEDGRYAVCIDPEGVPFRLWQAGTRLGAQAVNEPGAWNFSDLYARDRARPPRRSMPACSDGPSTTSARVDDPATGLRRPSRRDRPRRPPRASVRSRRGSRTPSGGSCPQRRPGRRTQCHLHRPRPRRNCGSRPSSSRFGAEPGRHRVDSRRAAARSAGRRLPRPASSATPYVTGVERRRLTTCGQAAFVCSSSALRAIRCLRPPPAG